MTIVIAFYESLVRYLELLPTISIGLKHYFLYEMNIFIYHVFPENSSPSYLWTVESIDSVDKKSVQWKNRLISIHNIISIFAV